MKCHYVNVCDSNNEQQQQQQNMKNNNNNHKNNRSDNNNFHNDKFTDNTKNTHGKNRITSKTIKTTNTTTTNNNNNNNLSKRHTSTRFNQTTTLLLITVMTTTTLMTRVKSVACSPDARRLYEDLLKKGYNKLIRPVSNSSDTLTVRIGLRLTQIIDVDEKNQIMTTNVWLEQKWSDTKLSWNPANYGNVERLYVPSGEIWLPDIVLYNSADGNFTVKLMTKATIHHNGTVVWKPPAIYKSLCPIDVEFFPFDEQKCTLKIGSWSYDGFSVDIKHISLRDGAMEFETIADGIDLADYYKSTEWDLLAVPAKKYCKYYPCCSEPYPDIKFSITIRRKTLFHTVNLILPCVAICSVTLLVFYIPANSGEKITMGITILNSLNIFLLLVAEINPPTSLAIPLIGKYLLFTMVLVTCSIIVTVFVLNVHFRSPSTHVMSPWIQELFLNVLPKLLFMRRPRSCKDGLGSYASRMSMQTCQGMEIVGDDDDYDYNVQPPSAAAAAATAAATTTATAAGKTAKLYTSAGRAAAAAEDDDDDDAATGVASIHVVNKERKQRPIRSQAPFLQSPIGRDTESCDDDLSPIRSIRNLKKCRTLDDESCGHSYHHHHHHNPDFHHYPDRHQDKYFHHHHHQHLYRRHHLHHNMPTHYRSCSYIGENDGDDDVRRVTSDLPPVVMQAVIGVNFIADHLKQQEEFNKIKQDWQFVAMVLDRLFLWMFTAACVVGTFGIIVQAPTLYDNRLPIPKNAQ